MRFLTLVACAAIAVPAVAQSPSEFAKPEDAIKYRKSALAVMGEHFSRIGAVVKGARPYDAKKVAHDAAIVEQMSSLPWQAFVEGSDLGETRAKPEIWQNRDKFREKAQTMQSAVQKLSTAAKSGDQGALKTAFGDAAGTCKSCHDDYRSK